MQLNITCDADGTIPPAQLAALGDAAADGPDVAEVWWHGWWNGFADAADLYDRMLEGCERRRRELQRPPRDVLTVLCHWPSMVSEDRLTPVNLAEPLSFWAMSARAERIGRTACFRIYRQILDRVPRAITLHAIAHSFGCKVAMGGFAMLSQFPAGKHAGGFDGLTAGDRYAATLLQAAFPVRDLEAGFLYGPTRDLIDALDVTTSPLDFALGKWWPLAHVLRPAERRALGFDGPTPRAADAWGGKLRVIPLAQVHAATPGFDGPGGHHCDLEHAVIYDLINQ